MNEPGKPGPVEVPPLATPAAASIPAPRLLRGSAGPRPFQPVPDVVYEVGDLLAEQTDGTALPANKWSTGDPHHDRRAFASTFLGCSNVPIDPKRVATGGKVNATYEVGGVWRFATVGEIKADDPVGPMFNVIVGELLANVLESVPADESVGRAVAACDGGWVVELRKTG